MAVYKIFPSKDSTIYSINPDINSGLDEILEISYKNNSLNYFNPKVTSPSFDYSDRSRILIHFDDLYNKIEELNLTEYDLSLKLYIATASSLKDNLKIIAHPISSFWENGIGKNYNNVSEGVSWNKSTSLTNATINVLKFFLLNLLGTNLPLSLTFPFIDSIASCTVITFDIIIPS